MKIWKRNRHTGKAEQLTTSSATTRRVMPGSSLDVNDMNPHNPGVTAYCVGTDGKHYEVFMTDAEIGKLYAQSLDAKRDV